VADQTHKVITIRVDDIVIDPTIQPRVGGIDNDHVRALEEAIDGLPSLSVVVLNGGYVLVDGWHRLAALQNQGRAEVSAVVLEVPADDDVHRMAFELNASHGRPLLLVDRRAEAARELETNPKMSDREIGRRCGLSQPTVAKIRANLEQSAQISRTTSRVGKGGYHYEVGETRTPSESKVLEKIFDRFLDHMASAVSSEWWDAADIVQMLLDVYEQTAYAEILEALQGFASTLDNLAQVFESAMD
jgi:predicted transcriptional regulator